MLRYLRHLQDPVIVLLYGSLIAYYYAGGYLAFLVNPVYNGMILTAGILMIGLGIQGLFAKHSTKDKQVCERPNPAGSYFMLILLLSPLILGFLVRPQPLSSQSALLRGVSSNLSVSDFSPTAFAKPSQERTLEEWIKLINVDPEPDHYKDQPVKLVGSVIVDDTLPENMFYVGRFILTCCAADARSIVLPVRYDPAAFQPANDMWLEVSGKMGEAEINGNRQVIIELESTAEVPVPENPYASF